MLVRKAPNASDLVHEFGGNRITVLK